MAGWWHGKWQVVRTRKWDSDSGFTDPGFTRRVISVTRQWLLVRPKVLALLLFSILAPTPGLAEDVPQYPDIWGRSLVELGIVPADPKERIDLGIGIHAVYRSENRVVLVISVNKTVPNYYIIDFFPGSVSTGDISSIDGRGLGEKLKERTHIKIDGNSVSSNHACAYGSLGGSMTWCPPKGCLFGAKSTYWVSRMHFSKPVAVVMDTCNDYEYKAPPNQPVFHTRDEISSSEPSYVDLGDGTFLAWAWGIDIVRFRADGTTPYRPRDTALIGLDEVNDLERRFSLDPRGFHEGLDALLKTKGY